MKGAIDTLSEGFGVVAKRFWIIVVPVILDLFLWRGPRISLMPLIERWLQWMNQTMAQPNSELWQNVQQLWQQGGVMDFWREFGQRFNVFSVMPSFNILSFLSLGMLDLPSIATTEAIAGTSQAAPVPAAEINSLLALALALLGLLVVGLVITVIFQGLIAQEVREENINLRYLLRRLGPYSWSLFKVAVSLALALVIIGWPLAILFFVISALSPLLMQLMMLLSMVVVIWFAIYLSLIPQGILLGEERPLMALWTSANLVHRNFGSLLLLLILVRLIRSGFALIWPILAHTTAGTIVAIIGNAFLSAGLAAASFVFYRDRFAIWREQLAQSMLAASQQPQPK